MKYKFILDKAYDNIATVIGEIEQSLFDAKDILSTIDGDYVGEITMDKIGDIEYIVDSLLDELK